MKLSFFQKHLHFLSFRSFTLLMKVFNDIGEKKHIDDHGSICIYRTQFLNHNFSAMYTWNSINFLNIKIKSYILKIFTCNQDHWKTHHLDQYWYILMIRKDMFRMRIGAIKINSVFLTLTFYLVIIWSLSFYTKSNSEFHKDFQ